MVRNQFSAVEKTSLKTYNI